MQPPTLYAEDPHFMMPQKFLSNDVYKEALESLVIVVTDVLFVDRAKKTIYLAKRKVKPMQDFWLIGGRVLAGEDAIYSIRRCVKRETGLELPADRFQFLTLNRYLWKDRAQEPQEKGADTLGYTFAVDLSPEERSVAAQNLDSDEYDTNYGLQEFDVAGLADHPMRQAITDLYTRTFEKR